ncbi:MAG: CoA pyrophosphatase [Deltaproteobacteria bacterium]|nr:CoA pyrophosphatase [Deltaproteobacteria bacterium]
MTDVIPAAVLIPIFLPEPSTESHQNRQLHIFSRPVSSNAEILFTVRTDTVEHHKGQISFPGGKRDDTDASLLETALRETEEEIGLSRENVEIIGELSDTPTVRTSFLIRPFVGLVRGRPALSPSEIEIAETLFVPLAHLLDEANSTLETYEYGGSRYRIKAYHYQGHRIWGATARILQVFLGGLS